MLVAGDPNLSEGLGLEGSIARRKTLRKGRTCRLWRAFLEGPPGGCRPPRIFAQGLRCVPVSFVSVRHGIRNRIQVHAHTRQRRLGPAPQTAREY